MKNQIFFSYSTKNQALADEIVEKLIGEGFIVWQDWRYIEAAANWIDKIHEGLENAAAMMILWSPEAAASKWVKDEIQAALIKDDCKILQLLIDDHTDLYDPLRTRQAIKLSRGLNEVIKEIKKPAAFGNLRCPRLGFRFDKTLEEQVSDKPASPLVSVPFIDGASNMSQAFIVGNPDLRIYQPEIIQVCLQFTRTVGDNMVEEVAEIVQHLEHDHKPIPLIALHITGPNDGKNYVFDPYRPAQWFNALNVTLEALDEFRKGMGGKKPMLQIFSQAPASLTLALGKHLYNYYPMQLFQYVRKEDRQHPYDTYQPVLDFS